MICRLHAAIDQKWQHTGSINMQLMLCSVNRFIRTIQTHKVWKISNIRSNWSDTRRVAIEISSPFRIFVHFVLHSEQNEQGPWKDWDIFVHEYHTNWIWYWKLFISYVVYACYQYGMVSPSEQHLAAPLIHVLMKVDNISFHVTHCDTMAQLPCFIYIGHNAWGVFNIFFCFVLFL